MESAAHTGDCNTNLDLGLGFRHELFGRKKKLKHGRSDKLFPFLALGFPEPNYRLKDDDEDDDGKDAGDRKRSDDAAVASSFAAVSSPMFSQASKLSDEEDEDYGTTPRKKLRLSKDQISALEDIFKVHSTLNPKQKQELATQLKLLPRQVEVWFQNRRARVKVKQTEMEREELRKSCESLKEENRRLKKEVMQLKSIKKQMALPSFLMHIGSAPPLCPSCGCTTNNNASPPTTFFSSNNTSSKIRKTRSPL